jgi:hypothetical protein
MITRATILLSVAAVLETNSSAPAVAQDPAFQRARSTIQRQIAANVDANDRFLLAPDQTSPLATYFDPTPAPSKAYTYAASVRLQGMSRRMLN